MSNDSPLFDEADNLLYGADPRFQVVIFGPSRGFSPLTCRCSIPTVTSSFAVRHVEFKFLHLNLNLYLFLPVSSVSSICCFHAVIEARAFLTTLSLRFLL